MKPEYVATKSAWKAVTVFRVLFFWLIIPLIVMICQIVVLKHDKIYFFDNKVIRRSGVFARREQKSMFSGVISVSVDQSFGGRIFGYGDVKIDVVGKWDIDTRGIKDPQKLQNYLETKIVSNQAISTTIIA